MPRYIHSAIAVAAAAGVAGCTDRHSATAPRTGAKVSASRGELSDAGAEVVEHEGLDAAFDSLSARAPGFAGLFYEDSVYVVLVAGSGSEAQAVDAATKFIRGQVHYYQNATRRLPEPRVVARPAARAWPELMRVRDLVRGNVDDQALVSLDVNERENRVVVGIRGDDGAAAVRTSLRRLGAQEGSFRVEQTSPPQQDQNASLLSRARPIPGGMSFGLPGCTMMVGAKLNGQFVALTNSHCTAVSFAPDGGATQQPWGASAVWGREVQDLSTYRCGVWHSRKNCRRADLAAYSYDGIDLQENEFAVLLGTVARPIERRLGPDMIYGSLLTGFPALTTVGFVDNPIQGEIVDRVGSTTGWQYGSVYQTCTDMWQGGVLLVCQSAASTFSEPGDSGSPVFRFIDAPNGSQILLIGINWGSYTTDASGFFSAMRQIRQEMPSVCFVIGC